MQKKRQEYSYNREVRERKASYVKNINNLIKIYERISDEDKARECDRLLKGIEKDKEEITKKVALAYSIPYGESWPTSLAGAIITLEMRIRWREFQFNLLAQNGQSTDPYHIQYQPPLGEILNNYQPDDYVPTDFSKSEEEIKKTAKDKDTRPKIIYFEATSHYMGALTLLKVFHEGEPGPITITLGDAFEAARHAVNSNWGAHVANGYSSCYELKGNAFVKCEKFREMRKKESL